MGQNRGEIVCRQGSSSAPQISSYINNPKQEFRKRRKNETEKEYVKKLTAEFCISSTLHHINVVETVDLVQDENQHWCEVMEFCPGGDLYAAIKKGHMSPSEIECCFKQILCGVSYLHSQGVAHRDIKPENLFFDTKGHLKVPSFFVRSVATNFNFLVRSGTMAHRPCTACLGRRPYTCRRGSAGANLTSPRSSSSINVSPVGRPRWHAPNVSALVLT